jgi:hypothetical protein
MLRSVRRRELRLAGKAIALGLERSGMAAIAVSSGHVSGAHNTTSARRWPPPPNG